MKDVIYAEHRYGKHLMQLICDEETEAYYLRHLHPNGAILDFEYADTDRGQALVVFAQFCEGIVRALKGDPSG